MTKVSLALASVLAATGVQAATINYDFDYPLSTTEIGHTGTLGLFDSSLGTLTGATLTLNGEALFSFSGENVAAQTQSASITSSTTLSWSSSLGALTPYLTDLLLSATSGTQSYAVGETKNFGPIADADSAINDLGSILGALQANGGGDFTLSCSSLSGLNVLGGGGNINTTQNTQAGCGASILYTYSEGSTEVPVPGTLALFGLALTGLGVASRRRVK